MLINNYNSDRRRNHFKERFNDKTLGDVFFCDVRSPTAKKATVRVCLALVYFLCLSLCLLFSCCQTLFLCLPRLQDPRHAYPLNGKQFAWKEEEAFTSKSILIVSIYTCRW